MGNEALLLLLVIGWAAVLLPSALRSRMRSARTTVGGFERTMDVLRGRPQGREILVPRDASRANRIVGGIPTRVASPARGSRVSPVVARRRQWFLRLLGATGASLLLALALGGVFVTLFLLAAGVLGGYVTLLRHFKVEQDRAREVVRTIDLRPFEDEPARRPIAVGAEQSYAGLQVATRPDDPWQPQSGVRIRRWDG